MSVSAMGSPMINTGTSAANPDDNVEPPLSANAPRQNPIAVAPLSPRNSRAGCRLNGRNPASAPARTSAAPAMIGWPTRANTTAMHSDGDQRQAGGEAVETVDDVERVRHANQPHHRQRYRPDTELDLDVEEMHDAAKSDAARHGDQGSGDVNQELATRAHAAHVVEHRDRQDRQAPGNQPERQLARQRHAEPPRGGSPHRGNRADDRQAAQAGGRFGVRLPATGHIDRPNQDREAGRERRERERDRRSRQRREDERGVPVHHGHGVRAVWRDSTGSADTADTAWSNVR